ncbi:MAG: protein kinase [Pirellulaceae bacterium]|nr:protein kinase [Pirellulaceae bacterium]
MHERDIFLEALKRPDLATRAEYLAEVCGDDTPLRARLDELLAGYHDVVSVLNRNPAELLGISGRDDLHSPRGTSTNGDSEPPSPEKQLLPFLEPSTRLDALGRLGHYEILQVVGTGGFGIVAKAFDEHLHRIVAIKVLTPSLAGASPPRKRFLREARSAALVRHENIVQIYAVEEHPLPYLVMEYIDGRSVEQLVHDVGPLEPAEVVRLGRQIALGLAAAHDRGLMHRDVKPANILLESGSESRVKLTDFGVARAVDAASMTQSGPLAGTPMFMAPEQIRGERVDHRADLFSLGSVLYTMCVGHPPFRAPNTFAILKRVAEDTPRPILETVPEVPEGLQAVIARLHRKNPGERFATAHEVANALSCCMQDTVTLPAGKSRRSGWKRPVLAAIALVLLVALSWGFGQILSRTRPGDARREVAFKPPAALPVSEEPATTDRNSPPDEVEAAEPAPVRTEAERWEQEVALMPAEGRIQAVVARLRKLNPGNENPKPAGGIKDDVVVLFAIQDTRKLFDLSPVRALRGLKELRLVGEEHLDLEPLRGMELTHFDSNGNQIRDLSPLSSMPLEWLGVWGYAGTDLSALGGMKLTGLNCGASVVKDLSPLRGMPLTYLCVNISKVADLSPLSGMPLRALEIERTQVSDLTPLADLPLERLSLRGSPIKDYSPLAKMPLKELRLDYDPAVHQELLRSIPTLEVVNRRPIAEVLGSAGN